MFLHRGLVSEPLKFPQTLGVLAIPDGWWHSDLVRLAGLESSTGSFVRVMASITALLHILLYTEDRHSPTDFVFKAVFGALRGLMGCSYYTISGKWRPQNKHSIEIQLPEHSFHGGEIFNDRIYTDVEEWRWLAAGLRLQSASATVLQHSPHTEPAQEISVKESQDNFDAEVGSKVRVHPRKRIRTELHIRCTMLFLVAYFRSESPCQIQEIMKGPTEREFLEEHTGDQSKRHSDSSGSARGAEDVIRTSPELIEVNSAEAPGLWDFVQAPHTLDRPMTIAEARQSDFGLAKAKPFERTYY
jgi:hypothetical protein